MREMRPHNAVTVTADGREREMIESKTLNARQQDDAVLVVLRWIFFFFLDTRDNSDDNDACDACADGAELLWMEVDLEMRGVVVVVVGKMKRKSRPHAGIGYVGPVGTSARDSRNNGLEGAPTTYNFRPSLRYVA